MFDFTNERKEKYYRRAEEYLLENELNCFINIVTPILNYSITHINYVRR